MVVRIMSSFTTTQNFLTKSNLLIFEDTVYEQQLQIQINTWVSNVSSQWVPCQGKHESQGVSDELRDDGCGAGG